MCIHLGFNCQLVVAKDCGLAGKYCNQLTGYPLSRRISARFLSISLCQEPNLTITESSAVVYGVLCLQQLFVLPFDYRIFLSSYSRYYVADHCLWLVVCLQSNNIRHGTVCLPSDNNSLEPESGNMSNSIGLWWKRLIFCNRIVTTYYSRDCLLP